MFGSLCSNFSFLFPFRPSPFVVLFVIGVLSLPKQVFLVYPCVFKAWSPCVWLSFVGFPMFVFLSPLFFSFLCSYASLCYYWFSSEKVPLFRVTPAFHHSWVLPTLQLGLSQFLQLDYSIKKSPWFHFALTTKIIVSDSPSYKITHIYIYTRLKIILTIKYSIVKHDFS